MVGHAIVDQRRRAAPVDFNVGEVQTAEIAQPPALGVSITPRPSTRRLG
jgi:hypothetical protein